MENIEKISASYNARRISEYMHASYWLEYDNKDQAEYLLNSAVSNFRELAEILGFEVVRKNTDETPKVAAE